MFKRCKLALIPAAALLASAGLAQPPGGQGQAPRPSLRERAAKGDPEAQFNLAKMYETGRSGYTKNFVEAERWYRKAADQGDVFAQASLAILYRFGKGIPQDLTQAYMWFELAASHISGADQESILELRDSTAAHMTPQQVAEARRLASEWKPAPAQ